MNFNKHIFIIVVLVIFIIIIFSIGCDHNSNPLNVFKGRWVSDIQFTYSIGNGDYTISHDNRIYESSNFLIFSDASSDETKKQIAYLAEKSLRELMQLFEISRSIDLGISDQNTKIKIYANKNMLSRKEQFFPIGMIIYSLDSPRWLADPHISIEEYFPRVLKHELMHVFQHLLGLGLNGYDDWPDLWFHEGIAEYVTGGVHSRITTLEEVDSWFILEDHVNPISIHQWSDYPVPIERIGEYYPMYHLAVKYVLSKEGGRKKLIHVKKIYEALNNGNSFADAFETHIGMSLQYYEDNFYELISRIL